MIVVLLGFKARLSSDGLNPKLDKKVRLKCAASVKSILLITLSDFILNQGYYWHH